MNWITLDEDSCLKYASKRTVSLVDDDDDDNKDLKSVNICPCCNSMLNALKKNQKMERKKLKRRITGVRLPASFVLFKSHSNH